MPDKFSRYVNIFSMTVHPANARGRPPVPVTVADFQGLAFSVAAAARNGTSIQDDLDPSGRYLLLQDVLISSTTNSVAMVWTLGNQAASDPAFHHAQQRTLRTVEMLAGEGVAVSAHMVIDLNDPEGVLSYRVGLEDIEGISRTRVTSLLQLQLRQTVTEVSASVEGREKRGLPSVVLDSVPGPLMGLSGGRPVSIEVVRRNRRGGLVADDGEAFDLTREELVYRPSPEIPRDRLVKEITDFVSKLQGAHPSHNITVHWKNEGSDKLLRTSIEPHGRAEDLLQRALTFSVQLDDFQHPIPSATEEVNGDLVTRILEVLRSPPP